MSEFRLVKAKEAAAIMGVKSVTTFYAMNIPSARMTGASGDRLWSVRDLEAAFEKRKSRKDYLRAVRKARRVA